MLSHSLKKQEEAKKMGADNYYATSDRDTFKRLKGYFDLMINTVPVEIDTNKYLKPARSRWDNGRCRTSREGTVDWCFFISCWSPSLGGSAIGGIHETQEMLDFCSKHDITSDIEVIPIQKVNEAYERVLKSDVRYRFVIDIANSLKCKD